VPGEGGGLCCFEGGVASLSSRTYGGQDSCDLNLHRDTTSPTSLQEDQENY